MAKSTKLSAYLSTMLEKFVGDAIAQALAEKQQEHDAAIKKLEGELRVMTRRATAAETRIAAVNAALGVMPRRADTADLRAVSVVAAEQTQEAVDSAPVAAALPEPVAEPVAPKVQPSISGAHLSAEQKQLRSEVIRQFHERRKVENISVASLGPALGLAASRSYAIYDQWCKEAGVSRAKPPPWRRNRNK